MYIPVGLLFFLALWFFFAKDTQPAPWWLCALGLGLCAMYAPEAAMIVGALFALIFIPIGLFFLYAAGMHFLEKGAKALPDCWLFDGMAPKTAPPAIQAPELKDLRIARAQNALRAASHR